MIKISKESFGKLCDGQETSIYSISKGNFTVRISDYGAIVVSIIFSGSASLENSTYACDAPIDLVLGFDSAKEYEDDTCYFGALCGRFANRIKNGHFSLNGKDYNLALNNNGNHLHGGNIGFNRKLWKAQLTSNGICLSYTSPDGEEGYPGNLVTEVSYSIVDDNTLEINYIAKSDKDTIVNLTNHSYFNLSGHSSGTILNHNLKINASHFTQLDETGCPNGKISPVAKTPLDFEDFHVIGERINSSNPQIMIGNGYDHNYVLNPDCAREFLRGIPLAATASSSFDGNNAITMKMYTNKPGLQLYTGNYIPKNTKGKSGALYGIHQGFCLETQYFPDGINHSNFPSPVLKAKEEYNFTTIFSFSN